MAMSSRAALAALVAVWCLTTSVTAAPTTLQLLGQGVVPVADGKGPGTEQVVFDDGEKVAYLVGGSRLFVVDLAPQALLPTANTPPTRGQPQSLSVLQTVQLPTTVNDLSFCSTRSGAGYLALSANGATKVLPGSVTLFNRYLRAGGAESLKQLAQFTVGALPDQLEFSRDCRTILVSNEGEPETYSPPSLANDPEGSVSVINLRFCNERDDGYAYAYDDSASTAGLKSPHQYGGYGGAEPYHRYGHPGAYDKPPHHNYYEQPPYGGNYGPDHYAGEGYYSHPDNGLECTGAAIAGRVRTAGFTAWNDKKAALESQGVKLTGTLSGIGVSVAQDLEPEYTAFSADEKTAFVTLQENNAIAVLDVERAVITSIHALGFKDHSAAANPLDPSDQDGPSASIDNWPVFGMYQPDEIKSFRYKGADYIVMANEGDARDYPPGLVEEKQAGNNAVKNNLNNNLFPSASFTNDKLGRLRVLTVNGAPYAPFSDPANTGKFQKLFSFGARSFSIWRVDKCGQAGAASLTQVFDSAAQLEKISRDNLIDIWNSDAGNYQNSTWDLRSDNKGPEPEGLAIGPCAGGEQSYRPYGYGGSYEDYEEGGKLCLFLGTERLGVMFVYDISDPANPVFQSTARPPVSGDRSLPGPEGVAYARYTVSPGRHIPLVLVAYEADPDRPELPSGLGVFMVTDA